MGPAPYSTVGDSRSVVIILTSACGWTYNCARFKFGYMLGKLNHEFESISRKPFIRDIWDLQRLYAGAHVLYDVFNTLGPM
jgi:hypothetical protein